MDMDAIGRIAEIARGALEEKGYGASFTHDTEEGHQTFFVTDPASGRILAEMVIKAQGASKSQPGESAK